jgi:hypothetical protein
MSRKNVARIGLFSGLKMAKDNGSQHILQPKNTLASFSWCKAAPVKNLTRLRQK